MSIESIRQNSRSNMFGEGQRDEVASRVQYWNSDHSGQNLARVNYLPYGGLDFASLVSTLPKWTGEILLSNFDLFRSFPHEGTTPAEQYSTSLQHDTLLLTDHPINGLIAQY